MVIPGEGCTSEELFRYAGRAREAHRGSEKQEVVMRGKWKAEMCPSPRWFAQVTSDCSVACLFLKLKPKKRACVVFMFYMLSWRGCAGEMAEERGVWGGWMYGAAEEWLPGAELRDESQTGILFCQLECANGNVRAAGKLMNLIGEMPPLSPNAWSIAIVFCGCWSFFFMVVVVFLWCYFLIVFSSWHGSLWLRVWWWTLSQGNKGIDPRQESMFSSVTYKSGCVWKVIFELKFPNSVSKVNVNKRGRVPPQ